MSFFWSVCSSLDNILYLLQACIESLDKKEAVKLNSAFLPTVSKAANDPAPDVREANMGVIVALANRSGNKAILEKVNFQYSA